MTNPLLPLLLFCLSANAAELSPSQVASWYNPRTNGMVAASWFYPKGSVLRVTEAHNGLSVVVTVIERGPAHRLVKQGRVIDLSKSAFSVLADPVLGLAEVRVTRLK